MNLWLMYKPLFDREEGNSSSRNIPFRVRPNLSASSQTFLSSPILAAYIAAIAIQGGQCSLNQISANISLKGSTSKIHVHIYACMSLYLF